MLLYVGPDQIIPLSGFFGTVIGLALIFWGKLVNALSRMVSVISSKRPEAK